jgi:hypothetical protein
MASTSETKSTQQDLLDAIHSAQGTAIDMAENWTESLGEILPKLWAKPVAEGIPAPQQLSETAFPRARGTPSAISCAPSGA